MHRQSPQRQTKPKHSKPRQLQPLPSQRLTPGRTKRPSPRRRSRRRAFFPLSLSPHVPLFLPFVPPCLPPPPNEPTAPPAPSMSLRRAMESGTLSPATTRRGHQSLERQRRVPHARPQSPLAVPSDGLDAPCRERNALYQKTSTAGATPGNTRLQGARQSPRAGIALADAIRCIITKAGTARPTAAPPWMLYVKACPRKRGHGTRRIRWAGPGAGARGGGAWGRSLALAALMRETG